MGHITLDVDLYDLDTDDLIEEIEGRGFKVIDADFGVHCEYEHILSEYEHVLSEYQHVLNTMRSISDKKRMGIEWQSELDELLKDVLGRAQ